MTKMDDENTYMYKKNIYKEEEETSYTYGNILQVSLRCQQILLKLNNNNNDKKA